MERLRGCTTGNRFWRRTRTTVRSKKKRERRTLLLLLRLLMAGNQNGVTRWDRRPGTDRPPFPSEHVFSTFAPQDQITLSPCTHRHLMAQDYHSRHRNGRCKLLDRIRAAEFLPALSPSYKPFCRRPIASGKNCTCTNKMLTPGTSSGISLYQQKPFPTSASSFVGDQFLLPTKSNCTFMNHKLYCRRFAIACNAAK